MISYVWNRKQNQDLPDTSRRYTLPVEEFTLVGAPRYKTSVPSPLMRAATLSTRLDATGAICVSTQAEFPFFSKTYALPPTRQ